MTMARTTIAYPTLAEFLTERYRTGRASAREDARSLGVLEHTLIAWSTGAKPNRRYQRNIERVTGYSFIDRRFADAALAAGFPSDGAEARVAAVRTYGDLHALLLALCAEAPQDALGAFFGLQPTSMSGIMRRPGQIPEFRTLVEMLRKISEAVRHVRGDVFSLITSRAVIGAALRAYRQRRGATPELYAQRIGISPAMLRDLECLATGHPPPSRVRRHAPGKRIRPGFFKDPASHRRLLEFLTRERAELGRPESDGDAPETARSSIALHHSEGHGVAGEARLVTRLQTFIGAGSIASASRRLGIPKTTIREALVKNRMRPSTATRIRAALDRMPGTLPAAPDARRRDDGSVVDRVAALEREVARLRDQTSYAHDLLAAPPVRDGYVSPLSRERFTPRTSPVTDLELSRAREVIRRASECLGILASIADDASRARIQRELTAETDELFATLEGYLREFPSGALETLETMRRYVRDFHDRQHPPDPADASDPFDQ
ncbi:hypothetical protein HY480_03230 [Candidatus Uhrbacteria bacterium]|nr:hypothetical protein [Candidatus Uhrbacteria bacterium]